MLFLPMLKSFFSNATNVMIVILIALIALIVIPNSEIILEKFGFETRASLKQDLTNEKRNNEILVSVLEETDKKNEIDKESDKISDNKLQELDIENKKENTSAKINISDKNKKIKQIQTEVSSNDTKEDLEYKISEVQIDSIWASYCKLDAGNCVEGAKA